MESSEDKPRRAVSLQPKPTSRLSGPPEIPRRTSSLDFSSKSTNVPTATRPRSPAVKDNTTQRNQPVSDRPPTPLMHAAFEKPRSRRPHQYYENRFSFDKDWLPHIGYVNPLQRPESVPVDPTGNRFAPWGPVRGSGGIYHRENLAPIAEVDRQSDGNEEKPESEHAKFVKAYGKAHVTRLPKKWNVPKI